MIWIFWLATVLILLLNLDAIRNDMPLKKQHNNITVGAAAVLMLWGVVFGGALRGFGGGSY